MRKMTDKEKQEREALRLEIRARKELLRRLQFPLELIDKAAKKEKDKRIARIESARQYADYNDAQDAYGYGMITEEEFDAIVKAMELGEEYIENTTTPVEIAAQMLHEYVGRLARDVAGFEFELLPEKEQARIQQQNEEILAKRAARKAREEEVKV
jgi:hypothetical protein